MRAGVVWANTFNRFDPTSPFGGYKESGLRPRGRRSTACSPTSAWRTADGGRTAKQVGARIAAAEKARAARDGSPIETRRSMAGSTSARPTSCTSAGAFPRTRSRVGPISSRQPGGRPLANACRASRKDVRDAVRAARKAFDPWAARTAMHRGQILYRVAELMEGRRDQFVAEVAAAEGLAAAGRGRGRPGHRPLGLVRGLGRQADPGPGHGRTRSPRPYFNFTIPEPTGVVGLVAPERSSLLGPRLPAGPGLRQAATWRSSLASETRPLAGGHPGRGPRHLGRARAAWSTS